jgi:hypothetical protein
MLLPRAKAIHTYGTSIRPYISLDGKVFPTIHSLDCRPTTGSISSGGGPCSSTIQSAAAAPLTLGLCFPLSAMAAVLAPAAQSTTRTSHN